MNNDFSVNKWSTNKIAQYLKMVENGERIKDSPFSDNNISYKKGNIVFDYTKDEITELVKCAKDIVYFADKYCHVLTDEGVKQIHLREYQKNILRGFVDERYSILLASRQTGKTIISCIFLAWFTLFHPDKNVFLIANVQKTSKEIMDKIKVILENLPFFLKPGILKNDVMEMKFDNGSRLITGTTTKRSGIGFTISVLFLDEFAHVADNIQKEFYYNIYPTVSAARNSKVIITSTPNGFNLFYDLYNDAKKEKNEYIAYEINWWDVPGRDQAWYEKEVGNLGSEEAFNTQYGNSFITADGRLLSPKHIERLQKNKLNYILQEFEELLDLNLEYESFLSFNPTFDIEYLNDREHYFVFSIDIAEGGGGKSDNSVINIFEVDVIDLEFFKEIINPTSFIDFFGLKQVARFKCNTLSIDDFAKITYTLIYDICYSENVKVVVESNIYGNEFIKSMQNVFPGKNDFDEELIVKFIQKADSRIAKMGLKIKNDNKPLFAQKFKKNFHVGRINITDSDTIEECIMFGKDKKGRYKGLGNHDDLIMSCINVGEIFYTMDFADFVEERYDMIQDDIKKEIEQCLDKQHDEGSELQYDIYSILGNNKYKYDENSVFNSIDF